MADLDKYMGEYGREIKGIAEYTKLDLGMLVGLNLAYELRRVNTVHLRLPLFTHLPSLPYS